MKANPRPLALAAAVALLAVTGCGTPSPAAVTASPTAVTASPATAAAFGGTDLAWIEINIAMDEELLPLLDLAPTNADSAALKQLSSQVKADAEEELSTLRQLHDEAGLPAENPHEGMPMPGLVTPSLLATAAAQRGAAFDTLLTKSLREHLEQGHKLAGSEQTAGAETRTKQLAARILENRTATLARLEKDF